MTSKSITYPVDPVDFLDLMDPPPPLTTAWTQSHVVFGVIQDPLETRVRLDLVDFVVYFDQEPRTTDFMW